MAGQAEDSGDDRGTKPGQESPSSRPKPPRARRTQNQRRDAHPEQESRSVRTAKDTPQRTVEAAKSPRDAPECPLCSKPLLDLTTALTDPDSGAPLHFECVLERLAASENLGPAEKVVYIGAGTFAVVEFKDKNEQAFVVKRRIPWEKEGEKKDWRRSLSTGIVNL